ncbi:hypothetical protein D6C85_05646 [Aureobasidium pullulans]|uniref:Uncharacterized protein n=1 Tax=Aureobasidium pullulans TaxID=5580 RepID=A0A4S9WY85_AURPU|nr:hypothetical protein D6C85_05646 [Aureobasidium pullulans]
MLTLVEPLFNVDVVVSLLVSTVIASSVCTRANRKSPNWASPTLSNGMIHDPSASVLGSDTLLPRERGSIPQYIRQSHPYCSHFAAVPGHERGTDDINLVGIDDNVDQTLTAYI